MLIIGVSRETYGRFAPVLERREFDVNRVPSSAAALELLTAVRFDVAVVASGVADPGLPETVRRMRTPECASRHASIVVLADTHDRAVAQSLVGRGVSRIIDTLAPAEKLEHEVALLLETAPRLAIRLPTHLDTRLGKGPNKLFCQTENISITGMLLRMPRRPPLNEQVDFEIHLPAQSDPLRGVATVVRYTQPDREGTDGIGARFDSFSHSDHDRLKGFLEKHLDDTVHRPLE
jgi:hypothetical protein